MLIYVMLWRALVHRAGARERCRPWAPCGAEIGWAVHALSVAGGAGCVRVSRTHQAQAELEKVVPEIWALVAPQRPAAGRMALCAQRVPAWCCHLSKPLLDTVLSRCIHGPICCRHYRLVSGPWCAGPYLFLAHAIASKAAAADCRHAAPVQPCGLLSVAYYDENRLARWWRAS